jgi:hypothetical protein
MTIRKVIETTSPPLLFSSREQEELRTRGLRILQITFPMLRSINRKYSNAGGRFHTNAEYRREEDIARDAVARQVRAAHWITQKDDAYIVVFDVSFSSRRDDIDGPRKSHGDVLRPTPSRSEKQALRTKPLLTSWYKENPPAICDDSHIQQEIVVKHLGPVGKLDCVVTIYAYQEKNFAPFPLHQMMHQYLCYRSEIFLDAKGHLTL